MAIPDSKTKYLSFGCSYTEYGYPTYASFLGQHFDIRENLGMCGAGNRYIFHKLIATLKILDKADVKFTENDLITIQWYLSELKRILPENIESLETYRMKHTMDKEVQYCYSFDDGNGNIETCDDTHPHPYTHHEYAKYLSTFLKEDLMKKNPRDYSELFKFTDGMFIREAVEKSRVPINEVFPDYAQFGVIENNFSILSKYRGADIVPYLEDYKPLL